MPEPITPEYQRTMNMVADTLSKLFPGAGFVLLQFPLDGPAGQRTNYISNANRADMVAAMKEVVARFEGRHQEGGRA